jgi:hypothetical protein
MINGLISLTGGYHHHSIKCNPEISNTKLTTIESSILKINPDDQIKIFSVKN